VFGAVDDLRADSATSSKGLRGHLGALSHGTVTTGALKILGIGVSGVVASVLLTPRPRTLPDVIVGAGLVAGSANLLNLFDLRPGRTLKVAAAAATMGTLAGSEQAAAALGVALAALPDDLGERTMLGDTGANALGALLGSAVAAAPPRAVRYGVLAIVVALTLASERVSFSKVIEGSAPLHCLDQWGRLGR
jgi:UDP-N-acetylmuramyl pentapeptide phosphotransferase/UDP-N-acetylglucosamine-1-phosphate transferase